MTNIDYSNTLMYEFDGSEEFIIFCKEFKNEIGDKQVIWSKGTDYKDLFMKGFELNEQKQYKKAIKQLENALNFNPIGLAARFEMAESYICLKEYEKAKEVILQTKNILTSDSLIARFYRRLGFIFTEEANYELAYSCYKLSQKYENTNQASSEIKYISSKSNINYNIDCESIIKKNNLPIISKIGKHASDSTISKNQDSYSKHSDSNNNKEDTKKEIVKEDKKTTEYVCCRKCGAKLSSDSSFCNKCATKVLDNLDNIKKTRRCNKCGNILSDDSVYCQYCGSKDVVEIKEETVSDNLKKDDKKKTFKTPFIVACIVAVVLGIGWLSSYSEQLTLQSDVDSLNTKVDNVESKLKTAQSNASTYQAKANKYDSAASVANQTVYLDFRSDTYFVKGTSKTVNIYCNFNYSGTYTVSPSVSGSGVSLTWGNWTGSGYNNHCPMYVTCTSTGYGVITLSNTVNSHKIKIFVSGS